MIDAVLSVFITIAEMSVIFEDIVFLNNAEYDKSNLINTIYFV